MKLLNNISRRSKNSFSLIVNIIKSNPLYLFIAIPFVILRLPSTFFSRLPLIYIGFIILIHERTISSFYLLIILSTIEAYNRYIAKQILNNNEAIELWNYLSELDANKIKFQRKLEENLFSNEQSEYIKLYRSDNSHKIGYFFELITPDNIFYSQNKGFTIPNIMKNNNKTITYSCAFIRKKYNKLGDADKFFLFHEVGHLLDTVTKKRHSMLSNRLSIFTIILLFIFNLSISPFFYLFLILLIYFHFSKTENFEEEEEFFCDIFALKLLELEIDFDKKKFINQTKLILPIERQNKFMKFISNESIKDLNSIYLPKNNHFEILMTVALTYILLNTKLNFNYVLILDLSTLLIISTILWLRNNKRYEKIRLNILENCINK